MVFQVTALKFCPLLVRMIFPPLHLQVCQRPTHALVRTSSYISPKAVPQYGLQCATQAGCLPMTIPRTKGHSGATGALAAADSQRQLGAGTDSGAARLSRDLDTRRSRFAAAGLPRARGVQRGASPTTSATAISARFGSPNIRTPRLDRDGGGGAEVDELLRPAGVLAEPGRAPHRPAADPQRDVRLAGGTAPKVFRDNAGAGPAAPTRSRSPSC